MKIKRYIQHSSLSALMLFLATIALAKPINLYTEPNSNSKVVDTINSENGLITIFQPKNSDWIKVANPQNGNVGWTKTAELSNAKFNLQIIQSDQGPHHYQIIQYGNMPPAQNQSLNAQIEQMQKRQQLIQKEMQQNMQNMFRLMQEEWANFPMIMPVFMTIDKKQPAANANTKATTTQSKNVAEQPENTPKAATP